MANQRTPEQDRLATDEFEGVLADAAPPFELGQTELFTSEEEQYIQREVERMLYEPSLPNAGKQERRWVERLNEFAHDDNLIIGVRMLCRRYSEAFQNLLPSVEFVKHGTGWLTLPGFYYTRRPMNYKQNKADMQMLSDMAEEAKAARRFDLKWLADFLRGGPYDPKGGFPEPVANFKLECLYLLRGTDGMVKRLVRLVNVKGEVSEGQETGNTTILPSDLFASAEKFRGWCLALGNFNWGIGGGAGNNELQMLHADVSSDAAYRVVKSIEAAGWHEVHRPKSVKESVLTGGVRALPGLWFCEECAIPPGEMILPDEDGIFWYEEIGYAFARKGRETEFTHGRPQMKPHIKVEKGEIFTLDSKGEKELLEFDRSDWSPESVALPALSGFFREVCQRFYDTAGGYEGFMGVGAMLGYAAAPEIFHERKLFPSLWVHGQMGSGKTVFCSWLMSMQGFTVGAGLGLISRQVTPVGIMCQLENYSNVALWLDEFRQSEIPPEKLAILRDQYNRQLAAKWSPDGFQRVIRTAALVSGESTTTDPATRSRYPHVQMSEHKRLKDHLKWAEAHAPYFFLFFRELLLRRTEFVEMVFSQIQIWMEHPDLAAVPTRDRITHSVCYASFAAATAIFESHGATDLSAFRKFMAAHAKAAAMDVQAEVNVNVFIQDLITAYRAGKIPNSCFRVESSLAKHPPGAPGQPTWQTIILYIEPAGAIAALQEWMVHQRASVTLRQKDLRDQLSKNEFWVKSESRGGIKKRFGPAGSMSSVTAWGIYCDLHPLGYQLTSDEEYNVALKDPEQKTLADVGETFSDGDPRRGPLYAIVDGVTREAGK